jgi:hypothetical protein
MTTMNANQIQPYVKNLSSDARADIVAGQWDEVMTDALYAACGAETHEEMTEARSLATEAASE